MTAHAGDMTAWDEITCQRGCSTHAARRVEVDLACRHGYGDYAQVPKRLARAWLMMVWDPDEHPVDGGHYCPAHDAVSETIVATGIWEPPETILVAEVLRPFDVFLDLGCQVGWYSMLALACGATVLAIDADAENLRLADCSADLAGDHNGYASACLRISPDTPPMNPTDRYRLVKIDLEGAEDEALRVLGPCLDDGLVDHLLVEVTPAFKPGEHYPSLVVDMVARGYEAYLLPPKRIPPIEYHTPEQYLDRVDTLTERALRDVIARCDQEMVWFKRAGADW